MAKLLNGYINLGGFMRTAQAEPLRYLEEPAYKCVLRLAWDTCYLRPAPDIARPDFATIALTRETIDTYLALMKQSGATQRKSNLAFLHTRYSDSNLHLHRRLAEWEEVPEYTPFLDALDLVTPGPGRNPVSGLEQVEHFPVNLRNGDTIARAEGGWVCSSPILIVNEESMDWEVRVHGAAHALHTNNLYIDNLSYLRGELNRKAETLQKESGVPWPMPLACIPVREQYDRASFWNLASLNLPPRMPSLMGEFLRGQQCDLSFPHTRCTMQQLIDAYHGVVEMHGPEIAAVPEAKPKRSRKKATELSTITI